MRILKWLMIFMIALVVLALLLVGYFYATAYVSIAAFKAEGVSAADRADQFASVKAELSQNAFIGTRFIGRLIEETEVDGRPAVIPTITGRAWVTWIGQYMYDPSDPFPTGFQF